MSRHLCMVDSSGNPIGYTFGLPRDADRQPRVRLDWSGYAWSASVLDAKGVKLAGPKTVADFYHLGGCRYADLNHDSQPDFIVSIFSGGCGLGSSFCIQVFAISSGRTYEIQSIISMEAGPEDFVDLRGDGQCEIIQTFFVFNRAEKEQDQRPHNYFVHHLLEIRNGKLQESARDRRFPRWIWYTNRPNHKATGRLSSDVKARLWKEQGQIFWKPAENAPATRPASR